MFDLEEMKRLMALSSEETQLRYGFNRSDFRSQLANTLFDEVERLQKQAEKNAKAVETANAMLQCARPLVLNMMRLEDAEKALK